MAQRGQLSITDHTPIDLNPLAAQHGGSLPRSYAEQKAFKAQILGRRKKPDEENFEEAESQAVRMWSEKSVRLDLSFDLLIPTCRL